LLESVLEMVYLNSRKCYELQTWSAYCLRIIDLHIMSRVYRPFVQHCPINRTLFWTLIISGIHLYSIVQAIVLSSELW